MRPRPKTTRRLILVGAGDHGRGVLDIVRRLRAAGESWDIIGFVDDHSQQKEIDHVPVLGSTSWLEEHYSTVHAHLVLSLADPGAKQRLARQLEHCQPQYQSVVHPAAEVSPSATLGNGTIVNAGAIIVYDAVLGPHVTVNLNASVGHHVRIGECATIAPGARILGRARLGARSQVHSNAVVLPGVQIGEDAIVGAGSVVLKDLPPRSTVFGNPARPVPRPA
ncbi:MAG: acetyltransferase [Acidobacteriota bacterium]